ncbi:hypothetical protein NFI96_012218, partial [Prochilodus magdalenae]
MACVQSIWLQWGTLCSLLALLCAQDSLWDCTERSDLLKDIPADIVVPSECTLGCTVLTYRSILETQEKLTVRFRDSYVGEPEEYCWPPKIKCSPGQQLQNAFVFLPVDPLAENRETFRLQISSADAAAEMLQQDTRHSLLPADCGLRFDVTEHLARKELQQALCVRVLPQKHASVRGALKCLPFLATTWKNWNQGE